MIRDFLFGTAPIVWVQRWLGPGFELPFELVSVLSSNWGILLVCSLSFWMGGRRLLYSMLALVMLESVIRSTIAGAVSAPRPSADQVIKYDRVRGSPSFPSGHMTTAGVLWGWAALRGPFPAVAAAAVVVLTFVGRIHLGVHYVGDVLAAFVIAAVLLLAWHRWWRSIERWLVRRPFRFYAGSSIILLVLVAISTRYLGESAIRWASAGFIAGAAIALPLEYRWVGYDPHHSTGSGRLPLLTAGVFLWIGAVTLDRHWGEDPAWLRGALVFAATLWCLLIAPAIFVLSAGDRAPLPRRGGLHHDD